MAGFDLVELLRKEWPVLKNAPWSVATVLSAAFVAGYAIAAWHYSAQIDSTKAEVQHYREAAGIDEPSPETALSILSNADLKLKGRLLVKRIRSMTDNAETAIRTFQQAHPVEGAPTEEEKGKRFNDLWELSGVKSREIVRELSADSINMLSELRRRIPEEARKDVMSTALPSKLREITGTTEEAFLVLMGEQKFNGEFVISQMQVVAMEIDQLCGRLPK